MRTHALAAALAAALLVAADTPKDDAGKKEPAGQKDLDRMQGTWSAVSGERDGNKAPETELKQFKIVIKDDKMTLLVGEPTELATFKLDPAKKPKAVDLDLQAGQDKGKTAHGIYDLEGDTLKICMAKPGKDRPTEFTTKAGSDTTLLVLKRDKS